VQLLSIDPDLALNVLDSCAKQSHRFVDQSRITCAIYVYFIERERLLDTIEILIRFADKSLARDPFPTIQAIIDDLLGSQPCIVDNIFTTLKDYQSEITGLTPMQNDSTTPNRDKLNSQGISNSEIDLYVSRLEREIDFLGLILHRISEKFGLR
jgi:hypothetical protein